VQEKTVVCDSVPLYETAVPTARLWMSSTSTRLPAGNIVRALYKM